MNTEQVRAIVREELAKVGIHPLPDRSFRPATDDRHALQLACERFAMTAGGGNQLSLGATELEGKRLFITPDMLLSRSDVPPFSHNTRFW